MREQIIVIDDLYEISHQYHKGFFENECVITDEIVGKISQILGRQVQIIQATNEIGSIPGVLAHLQCDWIAVIYLTLPLESFGEFGIKFYSHLATGLEAFPTQEEMIHYKLEENRLNEIFSSDLSLWKEYGRIPAKYNRMILFRGNRWHSYENNLNSSMLYQKLIIRNG